MTSLHPHQLWMAAADAGYSSFDEMQEDARLKRAEQLLRERREADARRHAIEVRLRKAMAAEQDAKARSRRNKERFKNALAILAFIVAILCLWASGAFGAPFAEGQRLERFRSLMPLPEYAQDASVLYYGEADIPRAYQLNVSDAGTTFHDHRENVAAFPDGMPSNANAEFPWNKPGGTDSVRDGYGVRFIRLPKGKPIVWWVQQMPDGYFSGTFETYRWRFPVGSAVGEMLILKGSDGKDRAYEVRVRHREPKEWAVEIFRPFANPQELADAIAGVRPDWQSDSGLRAAVAYLRSPISAQPASFTAQHSNPAVSLKYSIYRLPKIPPDVVNTLLDRIEFQDVTGAAWHGTDCFAPTADSYNIVPAGYAGHAIGADNEACAKCHNTVGKSARVFTPSREWYGRVRGADNIFSFHPVKASSIGGRPSFYEIPGVIERFDERRHNKADYQELE